MANTVLITGGSRGIGAAAVRLFASKGWNTIFVYKSSHKNAYPLASETGAHPFDGNVAVSADIEAAFAYAEEHFGGVDVLVNNAGISLPGMIQDLTEADFDELFNVNVKSQFLCIQRALPYMIRQKKGSIVNVSSMWGEVGGSCESLYSASKAAIIGMTKAMAKELGPSGIRVNCVSPGVIDTDMNGHLSAADMNTLAEETPLGRIGTPEEAAKAIYFLASDDSAFVTGQVLGISGGMVI